MTRDVRRWWGDDEADVAPDVSRLPAAGKVSLTQHLPAVQRRADSPHAALDGLEYLTRPAAAVQRKAEISAGEDPFATHVVHAAAGRGLAAPSAPLPYLDQIQRSFGHHDVTSVQAHVGGAAEEAGKAIGASAYAVGDHVAFASTPDLHTAAHEAAHVVQQQGGVQLKGGVGEEGDAYERHADAVADKVVAGESAQALLDQMAAPASGRSVAAAVQRRVSPHYADIRTRLTVGGGHAAIVESEVTQVLGWLRALGEQDLADTIVQLDADGLVTTLLDHVERAERTGRFQGLLGRIQRARTRGDHVARAGTLATRGGTIDADEAHEILTTLGAVSGDRRRMLVQDLQRAGRLAPFLAALTPADRSTHARVVADVERMREQFDDPMAGTHVATAAEAAAVDRILTPGVARGASGAPAAFRDTVAGRTYRQDLETALEGVRTWMATQSRALLAQPMLPGGIAALHPMADEAKLHTDSLFGHLATGSALRSTGPLPNLHDQSAIAGDAANMVEYLILNQSEVLPVHARHDAIPTRAAEATIINDVIRDWADPAVDAARVADMRIIDRGWPATAGHGHVRMHPREEATPAATRRSRWDMFQTIIHEYLHTVTHDNYEAVAASVGGSQESILIEGVTSLMTDKVWRAIYPAEVRANEALRASVEGSAMPFDASVIPTISHYDQIAQARQIEARVGTEELKAAYFLGHTELIGVGPAAATARTHGTQYTVPPVGIATVADVAHATGVSAATIAAENGIGSSDAVAPGRRLTVPGIRIHFVVDGETRARIADINGITVADLARANPDVGFVGLGPLAAGTPITIPVH